MKSYRATTLTIIGLLFGSSCGTETYTPQWEIDIEVPFRVGCEQCPRELAVSASAAASEFNHWINYRVFQWTDAGKLDVQIQVISGDAQPAARLGLTCIPTGEEPATSFIVDIILERFESCPWSLSSVLLHELGHTLGLKHNNDSGALMYPKLNVNSGYVGYLTDTELEYLRERWIP